MKFFRGKSKFSVVFTALMSLGLVLGSCGKGDGDSSGSTVTISGKMAVSGAAALNLAAVSLSEIVLYCVTFSSSPVSKTSEFGADGSFSVELPVDTAFGCFINNKTTNASLGTLIVGDANTGSSTLALEGDVDLGSLTFDQETGVVVIPASVIAKVASKVESNFNPDDMHNKEFKLSCDANLNSTDAQNLCKEFLADDGEEDAENFDVFFRIVKAADAANNPFAGLSIWASQEDFNECGGFDMPAALIDDIQQEDGITFSQASVGDWANCALRDEEEDDGGRPENMFLFEKLEKHAGSFGVRQVDTYDGQTDDGQGGQRPCHSVHEVGINFVEQAGTLYGAFKVREFDDCDAEPSQMFAKFHVRMTPR